MSQTGGDGAPLSAEYGETPIDEDARDFLTPTFEHLQTKDELNDAESSNIAVAVARLRENPYTSPPDLLNQIALRELHRRMFEEVWTWAGQIRKRETNLGIAPALIVQQWQAVFGDTLWWIDHETYPAAEIGVRFHRSMVAIHCFPNGNGRHARLAANELARVLGLGDRAYGWGARSGSNGPTLRNAYLNALQLADSQDDYGPLVAFALS